VASEVTLPLIVVVCATLLYALLGPWLLVRLLVHRRSRQDADAGIPWLGFAGTILAAYALVSFAILPGGGPAGAGETFARDAFVNVALSEVEGATGGRSLPYVDAGEVRKCLPTEAALRETEQTQKRNVVVVHLESARARSVTPYNEDIGTTPFLDELSKESLFAERAYTVVPHTTNALVAAICGIDPPGHPFRGRWHPRQLPPRVARRAGIQLRPFTSSVQTFERRPEMVKQLGYEEFYPVETMDKEGFQ
jgi:hypothetical protein